jgi:hypothetical protein
MKKFVWLILGLGLLMACNNGNKSPIAEVNYTNFESTALNISFAYPESWIVEEGENEVNIASAAQLLEEQNFSSGGVANITMLSNEFITGDLAETLNQFVGFMAEEEGTTIVEAAKKLTINGRNAAQSTLDVTVAEDTQATMIVTLILGQNQAVLIAAAYDEAQFGDMLNHVTESIAISD